MLLLESAVRNLILKYYEEIDDMNEVCKLVEDEFKELKIQICASNSCFKILI